MQMYANARILNSAFGLFCNRYITGLTESMSCMVRKPCWLQLKWEALFCAKDASLSKINAAMHVCHMSSVRFYTMWTWLLFCVSTESLVLPDLLSDVKAVLNGNMPAAVVSMPKLFPSASDISAMGTEDASDRMTVALGSLKRFTVPCWFPKAFSLKSLKAHRHASCSG